MARMNQQITKVICGGNEVKKTISVFLAVIMLFSVAAVPVFADDQQSPGPTWQNYIKSVTPVGDEPYVKLELTPTGYIFTDYCVPMQYDITFRNGTVKRVQVPRKVYYDIYYDGYYIGHFFDVDAGNETLTLYACIDFYQESKTGYFEIGQVLTVPEEYEGEIYDYSYYYNISLEPCRTEIDDSSVIARVLYPFYAVFEKIYYFFADIRYKLSQ